MTVTQTLQNEIQDSERWIDKAGGVYKRDLIKRIELIKWVLENMKNPDVCICEVIESKMNEIIDETNKKDSVIERDPLDSELRILDWIFYQVCSNKIKKFTFKKKEGVMVDPVESHQRKHLCLHSERSSSIQCRPCQRHQYLNCCRCHLHFQARLLSYSCFLGVPFGYPLDSCRRHCPHSRLR